MIFNNRSSSVSTVIINAEQFDDTKADEYEKSLSSNSVTFTLHELNKKNTSESTIETTTTNTNSSGSNSNSIANTTKASSSLSNCNIIVNKSCKTIDDSDDAKLDHIYAKRYSIRRTILFLVDVILSSFVFTPLVVLFWASTWDIIYLFIFPEDFLINILITFLISCGVLLPSHFLQNQFTKFHNKLHRRKTNTNTKHLTSKENIKDIESDVHLTNESSNCKNSQLNASSTFYYGFDFYFRSLYTYFLTVAYVCSWKTYWDLSSQYTEGVHFGYFLLASFISLFAYRLVLKKSFDNFTKMVPFYFVKDTEFEDYFIQPQLNILKNKIAGTFLNFFYFEIIEMIISTLAWKGIWDLLDNTTNLFNGCGSNSVLYSCLLTGLIGYTLFFSLIRLETFVLNMSFFKNNKTKKSINVCKSLIQEVILFASILSIIMIWRSFWTLYDTYTLELEYKNYVIIATHCLCFLILAYAKCGTALYGMSGSSIGSDEEEERKPSPAQDADAGNSLFASNASERQIINVDSETMCFTIKYVCSH